MAPIGGEINQCHFGDFRVFFRGTQYIYVLTYVLTFGAGQNNQCHGPVALVRMAPLYITNFERLRTWKQVHLPKQNSTIQTAQILKVQTYLAVTWPNIGPNTEKPKFELFWTLFVKNKNYKLPTPKISNLKPTNRVQPNIMQDFGN